MEKLLETAGLGIVQLDERKRVVAANDRARQLLRTGDGLFDDGGFLFARSPPDDARLQALLSHALPLFEAQGVGGSTIVRRARSMLPLVLHVNPAGRHETEILVCPVAVLVLVVDPGSRSGIDPAVTAAALDLTQTEGRVAVLLAQGLSVREVAAVTGRKYSTIRSHLKHIFAKHGLSGQAELVRLVLSLARSPEYRR